MASLQYTEFFIRGAIADWNSGLSIPEPYNGKGRGRNNKSNSNESNKTPRQSLHSEVSHLRTHDQSSETFESCNNSPQNADSTPMGKDLLPTAITMTKSNVDATDGRRYAEGGQLIASKPSRELGHDIEEFDIHWSDLVLKERIGSGIPP